MLRDNRIGASDAITASVFPARSLVGKIMDSFTRSISILRARGDPDEVSQAPAAVCLKSEDYGDSCKTPARKDRRGSYMRRFENAVTCAEKAGKFDPRNVEVAKQLTNVRLVARARARGNELFMSEKFTEACAAYEEGLKLTHPTRCFIVIELPVGLNLGCWRNLLKIATLPFASTLVMLRLFFEWLPQTVSLNDGLKLSEIMKF